ncbi:MAG TPA: ankyrin repeat domain-containing protein [Actinomycetota bacterium]|nr:ankyrin repeat domain-containing protein [Actinomycetota bacterium]
MIAAIVTGDHAAVSALLVETPELAMASSTSEAFLEAIRHQLYRGDTGLHIAAAGYRVTMVSDLVACGAEVGARNRRGAQPLHYAADGQPGSALWDHEAQRATVERLLAAGADPDAQDKGGASPLHRAVRTRCAAAVAALLEGGADTSLRNKHGSTPGDLATRTTGRGGSGSPAARAQLAEIRALLSREG